MVTVALVGDTMLGRLMGQRLATATFDRIFAPQVREITAAADICVLNLECCISDRGDLWPAPGKQFFFRAPPRAAEILAWLGVDCVTLANNHAMDFGRVALLDTLRHLANAGIAVVGAGIDLEQARAWQIITAGGVRLGILGLTDHPRDFAAGPDSPGVAFADLRQGPPDWLLRHVSAMADLVDMALVTPHWGPNMTTEPVPHVHAAADALVGAGADLVAGHSAHVVHGVQGHTLFDLGDFIDDYAVDEELRNDLSLLFLVTIDQHGPVRLEAVPLRLDFCFTRLATTAETAWLHRRFTAACAAMGTDVTLTRSGRFAVALR